MTQPPSWITFAVVSVPLLAALVDCGRSGPIVRKAGDSTSVNDVMKSPTTVLRAKLQPCRFASECTAADAVPRCALDKVEYIGCDTTDAGGQPIFSQAKPGFCYYVVPNDPATACQCAEGDIRYCDLAGTWQSCVPGNPGGCGIQMCQLGPLGQNSSSILAGAPEWGPCLPPGTFPVDSGIAPDAAIAADAGFDASIYPIQIQDKVHAKKK